MRFPQWRRCFRVADVVGASSSEAVRIQINWATKNRQSMGTENFYINRVKNVAAAHSAGFITDGEAAFTLGFEASKPKPVVAA